MPPCRVTRRIPSRMCSRCSPEISRRQSAPFGAPLGRQVQQRGGRRAVAGNGDEKLGHLQGSLVVGPLTDGQVQRFALTRFITVAPLPVPEALRKVASGFLGQVDSAAGAEAHSGPDLQQALQPDLHPQLVEVHIAGVLYGRGQCERTVSLLLPAPIGPVTEVIGSPAGNRHALGGSHHAEFEGDRGGRQLPRRSGRVLSHHRPVVQRTLGIPDETVPLGPIDRPREDVGIEGGSGIECENAPGLHVEGYDRSVHAVGEDVMDPLHQRQVQTEPDVRPGLLGHAAYACEGSHYSSLGVDLDIPRSRLSLQRRFVLCLNPGPPHYPTRLRTLVLASLDLGFVDLTHVSDCVRTHLTGRIAPLRPGLDEETRKDRPAFLQRRHRVEGSVNRDQEGPGRTRPGPGGEFLQARIIDLQMFAHPAQGRDHRIRAVGNDGHGVARDVVGQDTRPTLSRMTPRGAGTVSVFNRFDWDLRSQSEDLRTWARKSTATRIPQKGEHPDPGPHRERSGAGRTQRGSPVPPAANEEHPEDQAAAGGVEAQQGGLHQSQIAQWQAGGRIGRGPREKVAAPLAEREEDRQEGYRVTDEEVPGAGSQGPDDRQGEHVGPKGDRRERVLHQPENEPQHRSPAAAERTAGQKQRHNDQVRRHGSQLQGDVEHQVRHDQGRAEQDEAQGWLDRNRPPVGQCSAGRYTV